MKVRVLSLTEKAQEERDYKNKLVIEINGDPSFEVSDGEPEDANISRDFRDVFNIPDMLRRVHEAGIKHEYLEIVYEELEEI